MRELYKLLGIKLALSMAYHPQMDSQTERVNQVLEGYLHTFTRQRQDDWDGLLPMCQGTPAVVLTRANIHASTLNKGGSGDPGMWSIVGRAHARTGGI
jgi:hypothetical protein